MATEGAAGRSKNTGRVNPCQPEIQVLPWKMQDDIYTKSLRTLQRKSVSLTEGDQVCSKRTV